MTESNPRGGETRQRLGRGLAALLGEAAPESAHQSPPNGVKEVPIEFVRSNTRNPRQSFNEVELHELADSIREKGIIQPIIVRPVAEVNDAYEIVAGERRWRAAQRAGRHTVPVICVQMPDREALELSIVENVQRTDLNPLEEARGYAQLASEYGYSHSDIGRIVGKSRSHVANTLRLLALPTHTRKLLSEGTLSAGHARALLSVSEPDAVADRIVARGLTVRDVEKLREGDKPVSPNKTKGEEDPITRDLEKRVSLSLGTEIHIQNNKRIQEIRIRFQNLDQLGFICDKLMRE